MEIRSSHFKTNMANNIALAILFLIFASLCMFNLFTFCWSDEASYFSYPHRLFMGEKLFVDEWMPEQFYSPLLFPFYSLYMKIFGNNDGIFLTARLATVLIHSTVSFALYFSLKKKWNVFTSFSASTIFMIFCKSNILGASYYSFALDFFMIGILLLMNSKSKKPFFLAGISFAIAIISNPYIAVIYIGYSIFYLISGIGLEKTKKEFFSKLALFWTGTIFSAILYIGFLLSKESISEIFKNVHYIFLDPSHGNTNLIYKTLQCFKYILTSYPFTFPIMFASAVFLLVRKFQRKEISRKIKLFLFIMNFIVFFINIPLCQKHSACLLPPFFLAVICKLILNEKLFSGDEIKFFILPGFFLAVIFHWASDTNISAMAIGFALAIPGALYVIFDFTDNFFENKKIAYTVKILVATTLILTLGAERLQKPYRDSYIWHCTEKIEQGPAKGLYTSSERKIMYDEICATVNSLDIKSPDDKIFISPMMPWAYIMLNTKYGASQTWRIALSDYRLKIYYETENHSFPKYVIMLDEKYALSQQSQIASREYKGWFYDEILMKLYDSNDIAIGTLFTKKEFDGE